MLKTFVTPDHVDVVESVADWQEAVRLCARPLLDGGFIEDRYVQKIFDEYENTGPYFVVAPGIAMPHARPEDGVHKRGLSLLVVRKGVSFGCDNDPVRIVAMLCATDRESHVKTLSSLAEMLGDAETVVALSQATHASEVFDLIRSF
ncbi:MAG: PTS sugar transporter subunit IIA [Cardiobacteriaceae bacterium]|nr:PTS sugar transporter subunit IIA [Cardiobacteriaceae bacterium]